MQALTLEDALRAWASRDAGVSDEERDGRLRMQVRLLRALAEGRPLTPEAFADATGVPLDQVPGVFARLEETGLEFDGDGNLVGAALTLRPTPHRFRATGRDLYAWCSPDTLFLPGLLAAPAEAESACPVTEKKIRLHVTPEEVKEYTPLTTVLSIVRPGASCPRDRTGPASSMCGQTFSFAWQEAAERWVKDHPGVAILSVEDAFELARIRFIEPARRALDASS